MFEIGFFEMAVIGLVLLIVMGPEKLPEVARQAAFVIRKVRLWLTDMKSEMNNQTDGGFRSLKEATDEIAQLKQSVAAMGSEVLSDVKKVGTELEESIKQAEDEFLQDTDLDTQVEMQKLNEDYQQPELLDDEVAGKPKQKAEKTKTAMTKATKATKAKADKSE